MSEKNHIVKLIKEERQYLQKLTRSGKEKVRKITRCRNHVPEGFNRGMAEIELSALSKQCLDRRIDNISLLTKEVMAWSKKRNHLGIGITWQFTKNKARNKLNRFYITIKI